jgi:hypothetical protein
LVISSRSTDFSWSTMFDKSVGCRANDIGCVEGGGYCCVLGLVTCICEVKPWWVVESIAVTMLWWIGEVIAFCFLSSSLSDGDGLLCLRSLEISGVLKWLLFICGRSIGVWCYEDLIVYNHIYNGDSDVCKHTWVYWLVNSVMLFYCSIVSDFQISEAFLKCFLNNSR